MQQKIENAIQESIETVIALNKSIRNLVQEGCTNEQIEAVSNIVSALSELTTSLSQIGYMKHLGSSSSKVKRTSKNENEYVGIGAMVEKAKERLDSRKSATATVDGNQPTSTQIKNLLDWDQLDQESKESLLNYAARKGISIERED